MAPASAFFEIGTMWMFGGKGYGSEVHSIYARIGALFGHESDSDNVASMPFAHCISPRVTVKIRPTDYDEADEFVRVYVNGVFHSICDPQEGQGCDKEYTCLEEEDISTFMTSARNGTVDIRLVNSDEVTLATSYQATILTATTCNGRGDIGKFLLAAHITLDGCGTRESVGTLNDLWAFDGEQWKWHSNENNTDMPAVYGEQNNQADTWPDEGSSSADTWPGSRSRNAIWSDGSDAVWVFGGETADGNLTNELWVYSQSSGHWTWVGDDSTRPNEAGKYGQRGAAHPGNWPGARSDPAFWFDEEGTRWIFGGSGSGACAWYENGTCFDLEVTLEKALDMWIGEDEYNRSGFPPTRTAGPGALSDIWKFSNWCDRGLRLDNSPTLCSGITSQTCDYICDDGFYPVGIHRCWANRSFYGRFVYGRKQPQCY